MASAVRCTGHAFPCPALEQHACSCSAHAMRTLSGLERRALVLSSLALLLVACGGATPAGARLRSAPGCPSPRRRLRPPRRVRPGGGSSSSSSPAPAKAATKIPLDTPVVVSDTIRAIVNAKDRSDEDRKLDAGRHPAELLAFLGAAPGQRIVEMDRTRGTPRSCSDAPSLLRAKSMRRIPRSSTSSPPRCGRGARATPP